MILLIDNYDSFTWNLVQALGGLCGDVRVVANDTVSLSQIEAWDPVAIMISPGPGRPRDAGICTDVVRRFGPRTALLGVCLGHQVLCEALGAKVELAPRIFHGRTSVVQHDQTGIFADVPKEFRAARYHSLIVNAQTLPPELIGNAFADTGELMAVRHACWPAFGVQFHPESFLTEHGTRLLASFIAIAVAHRAKERPLSEVSFG